MIISSIVAFTAGFISGFLGFTGSLAISVCTAIGYLGAIAIYGGVALAVSNNAKKPNNSPTYAGVKQTQTNQDLPIPLLYGTVKLAGNRIWQDEESLTAVKRIVAFAEGEISGYSDIRLNDIPVNEIKGIGVGHYLGTNNQVVDLIVGGNNQNERAAKVGSLRNVAYLAINVPRSQKIDMNYNLTAVVKGRKIRVYTSPYNYTVKYSENPAWVMLDFLTAYNGLGLALNAYGTVSDDLLNEIFDLESFVEAAAFCDELVNGKPRFTFNMVFDSQTSARTLIDEIYRSCRGGLFVKNGKLQFKIDKAQPVSKVFTSEDILKGSETFQTIPSEEHYDILKCEYISPKHEWQKVEAFAEIPEYRDGVPIEHSVNLYSVTNFEQASRLAWYYVNAKRLQPYFGSFKTDYRAYDLEVGDVIMFDSLLMGLERYKVKVTSVTDDGAGTFTINWRTYDERLYSDELGSKEPRVLVSNLGDLYSCPDDVLNFNVVQTNNLFNFVWQSSSSPNDTYEIRMGDNWERGSVVASKITENKYSMVIPTDGLYRFWIKAFNGYSYSKNATLDVASVDSVPNVNEIVKIDILADMQGTFEGDIRKYHRTLKLKDKEGILWESSDGEWSNNGYYENGGTWGVEVLDSGVYESQVYDLGDILESIVSFDFQCASSDERHNVLLEWDFSDDCENWNGWKIINTGTYKFRYCRFKVSINSTNSLQTVLTKFVAAVDVPDKEMVRELEIVDPQGLRVEYNFINPPSIVATVNDCIDAYIVVTEKTNTYAFLQAYKNSGELTTCKLSLHAKGY